MSNQPRTARIQARGARRRTVLATLASLLPALAFAQPLPQEIVRATGLTPEQVTTIGDRVNLWAPMLEGDRLQVARGEILQGLNHPEATAPYRLELGRQFIPRLEALAASTDDRRAVNALRLAGEIATDRAVALLQKYLAAETPSIRYAAVFGLRRMFEAVALQAPAIDPGAVLPAVSALDARLKAETDPYVLDAVVRALGAALSVHREGFERLRPTALASLCAGAGQRIVALHGDPAEPDTANVLLRAGAIVRDTLADEENDRTLPEDAIKASAALGGEMVAHVVRLAEGARFNAQDTGVRNLASQTAAVGEAIIFFALRVASPDLEPATTNIGELLAEGAIAGDARAAVVGRDLVGPGGVLARPPFSFPADRFLGR